MSEFGKCRAVREKIPVKCSPERLNSFVKDRKHLEAVLGPKNEQWFEEATRQKESWPETSVDLKCASIQNSQKQLSTQFMTPKERVVEDGSEESPSVPGLFGSQLSCDSPDIWHKPAIGSSPFALSQVYRSQGLSQYSPSVAQSLGANVDDSVMSWTSSLATPPADVTSSPDVEAESPTGAGKIKDLARALFSPGPQLDTTEDFTGPLDYTVEEETSLTVGGRSHSTRKSKTPAITSETKSDKKSDNSGTTLETRSVLKCGISGSGVKKLFKKNSGKSSVKKLVLPADSPKENLVSDTVDNEHISQAGNCSGNSAFKAVQDRKNKKLFKLKQNNKPAVSPLVDHTSVSIHSRKQVLATKASIDTLANIAGLDHHQTPCQGKIPVSVKSSDRFKASPVNTHTTKQGRRGRDNKDVSPGVKVSSASGPCADVQTSETSQQNTETSCTCPNSPLKLSRRRGRVSSVRKRVAELSVDEALSDFFDPPSGAVGRRKCAPQATSKRKSIEVDLEDIQAFNSRKLQCSTPKDNSQTLHSILSSKKKTGKSCKKVRFLDSESQEEECKSGQRSRSNKRNGRISSKQVKGVKAQESCVRVIKEETPNNSHIDTGTARVQTSGIEASDNSASMQEEVDVKFEDVSSHDDTLFSQISPTELSEMCSVAGMVSDSLNDTPQSSLVQTESPVSRGYHTQISHPSNLHDAADNHSCNDKTSIETSLSKPLPRKFLYPSSSQIHGSSSKRIFKFSSNAQSACKGIVKSVSSDDLVLSPPPVINKTEIIPADNHSLNKHRLVEVDKDNQSKAGTQPSSVTKGSYGTTASVDIKPKKGTRESPSVSSAVTVSTSTAEVARVESSMRDSPIATTEASVQQAVQGPLVSNKPSTEGFRSASGHSIPMSPDAIERAKSQVFRVELSQSDAKPETAAADDGFMEEEDPFEEMFDDDIDLATLDEQLASENRVHEECEAIQADRGIPKGPEAVKAGGQLSVGPDKVTALVNSVPSTVSQSSSPCEQTLSVLGSKNSPNKFEGFSSAAGKQMTVSKTNLDRAKRLLSEDETGPAMYPTESESDQFLKKTRNKSGKPNVTSGFHVQSLTGVVKSASKQPVTCVSPVNVPMPVTETEQVEKSCGFSTASGNSVQLSSSALRQAEKLMCETDQDKVDNILDKSDHDSKHLTPKRSLLRNDPSPRKQGRVAKPGKSDGSKHLVKTEDRRSTVKENRNSVQEQSVTVGTSRRMSLRSRSGSSRQVPSVEASRDKVSVNKADTVAVHDKMEIESTVGQLNGPGSGFSTASGKGIGLSKVALQKAEALMAAAVESSSEPLQEIQDNAVSMNTRGKDTKTAPAYPSKQTVVSNAMPSLVDGDTTGFAGKGKSAQSLGGFATAAGHNIGLSKNALQKAEVLMTLDQTGDQGIPDPGLGNTKHFKKPASFGKQGTVTPNSHLKGSGKLADSCGSLKTSSDSGSGSTALTRFEKFMSELQEEGSGPANHAQLADSEELELDKILQQSKARQQARQPVPRINRDSGGRTGNSSQRFPPGAPVPKGFRPFKPPKVVLKAKNPVDSSPTVIDKLETKPSMIAKSIVSAKVCDVSAKQTSSVQVPGKLPAQQGASTKVIPVEDNKRPVLDTKTVHGANDKDSVSIMDNASEVKMDHSGRGVQHGKGMGEPGSPGDRQTKKISGDAACDGNFEDLYQDLMSQMFSDDMEPSQVTSPPPKSQPTTMVKSPVVPPTVVVKSPVVRPTTMVNSPVVRPRAMVNSPVVRPTAMVNSPVVQPTVMVNSPAIRPTAMVNSPAIRPTAMVNSPAIRPTAMVNSPVVRPPAMVNSPVVLSTAVPPIVVNSPSVVAAAVQINPVATPSVNSTAELLAPVLNKGATGVETCENIKSVSELSKLPCAEGRVPSAGHGKCETNSNPKLGEYSRNLNDISLKQPIVQPKSLLGNHSSPVPAVVKGWQDADLLRTHSTADTGFTGFSLASGKHVNISLTALKKAENLLDSCAASDSLSLSPRAINGNCSESGSQLPILVAVCPADSNQISSSSAVSEQTVVHPVSGSVSAEVSQDFNAVGPPEILTGQNDGHVNDPSTMLVSSNGVCLNAFQGDSSSQHVQAVVPVVHGSNTKAIHLVQKNQSNTVVTDSTVTGTRSSELQEIHVQESSSSDNPGQFQAELASAEGMDIDAPAHELPCQFKTASGTTMLNCSEDSLAAARRPMEDSSTCSLHCVQAADVTKTGNLSGTGNKATDNWTTPGFQRASGKHVTVCEESLVAARKVMEVQDDAADDIKSVLNGMLESCSAGDTRSGVTNSVKAAGVSLDNRSTVLDDLDSQETSMLSAYGEAKSSWNEGMCRSGPCLNAFQTASGKTVSVSDTALNVVRKQLSEPGAETCTLSAVLDSDNTADRSSELGTNLVKVECESSGDRTSTRNDLQSTGGKTDNLPKQTMPHTMETCENEIDLPDNQTRGHVFTTASGKSVTVTDTALKQARQFLTVDDEDLDRSVSVQACCNKSSQSCDLTSLVQMDARETFNESKDLTENNSGAVGDDSFRSASGKRLTVSGDSQNYAQQTQGGITVEDGRQENKTVPVPCVFETAAGKAVDVSDTALQHAKGYLVGDKKAESETSESGLKLDALNDDSDLCTAVNISDTAGVSSGTESQSSTSTGSKLDSVNTGSCVSKSLDAEGSSHDSNNPMVHKRDSHKLDLFKTAGGKSVTISDVALKHAKGFFKDDSYPETSADCTSKLNPFKTAGGNSVKISDAALEHAKGFFSDESSPGSHSNGTNKLDPFKTAGGKSVKISDTALLHAKEFFNDDACWDTPVASSKSDPFKTASGKYVTVSDADLDHAKGFFNDAINTDTNSGGACPSKLEPFRTAGRKSAAVSQAALSKAKLQFSVVDGNDDNCRPAGGLLQTASGKSVKFSNTALLHARQVLQRHEGEHTSTSVEHLDLVHCDRTIDKKCDSSGSGLPEEVQGMDAESVACDLLTTETCQSPGGSVVTTPDRDIEKNLNFSKQRLTGTVQMTVKGSADRGVFTTAAGRSVTVSERALAEAREVMEDDEQCGRQTPVSFSRTASEKKVNVSSSTLEHAKGLLNSVVSKDIQDKGKDTDGSSKDEVEAKQVQADEFPRKDTNRLILSSAHCFQTAGGKSVEVSGSALKEARNLLNDEDHESDGPQDGRKDEIASKQMSSEALSRQDISTKALSSAHCFQTAGGRSVVVSETALKQAKNLLNDDHSESEESVTSSKVLSSAHGFKTAGGKSVNVSETALKHAKGLLNDECGEQDVSIKDKVVTKQVKNEAAFRQDTCSKGLSSVHGFQTAGGRSVDISESALKHAKGLLNDECKEQDVGIRDEDVSEQVEENEAVSRQDTLSKGLSSSHGFLTAGGRSVDVSETALKHAKNLLNDNSFELEETGVGRKDETDKSCPVLVSEVGSACVRKLQELHCHGDCSGFKGKPAADPVSHPILPTAGGDADSCHTRNVPKGNSKTDISAVFQTAAGSCVSVSEDALLKAQTHLADSGGDIGRGLGSKRKSSALVVCEGAVMDPGGDCGQPTKRPKLSGQDNLSLEQQNRKEPQNSPFEVPYRANSLNQVEGQRSLVEVNEEEESMDMCSLEDSMAEEAEMHYCNLVEARRQQEEITLKKQGQKVRPVPGKLFLQKQEPGRLAQSDVIKSGKEKSVQGETSSPEVSAATAGNYCFQLSDFYGNNVVQVVIGDGAFLVPDDQGFAGKQEFYSAFLTMDGVDRKLISDKWLYNHYRWIVWKLAAYEVAAALLTIADRCLTPEVLMLQLKYRYDREVDHSQRSAVRKIVEKDDTPCKRMVLCVAGIHHVCGNNNTDNKDNSDSKDSLDAQVVLELTDGWYGIRTMVDMPLTDLVRRGRLCVGHKVCVTGAELTGLEDACSPLELPGSAMLKICYNGTRPAPWDSRLGYQSDPRPLCLALGSLSGDGGTVGVLDVVIVRKYPVMYMEKLEAGGCVFRCGRAEEREQQKFQSKQQVEMEKFYHLLERQAEKEEAEEKHCVSKKKWTAKEAEYLQSGHEIYEALETCRQPDILESLLSERQVQMMLDYRRQVQEEKQQDLNSRFQKAWQDRETPVNKRNVTPVLKFLVAGCARKDMDVKITTLLTVWRPATEISDLQEGKRYKIYNINTSLSRWRNAGHEVQLTATKQTKFRLMQVDENFLDIIYEPREVLWVNDLKRRQPPYGEVDLVVMVVQVTQVAQGDSGKVQDTVYCADCQGNLVAVKFWTGVKVFGVEDAVTEGGTVCASNLIDKSPYRSPTLPVLEASVELSHITNKPQNAAQREALHRLQAAAKDKKLFFDTARSKLEDILQNKPHNRVGRAAPEKIGTPVVPGTPASSSHVRPGAVQQTPTPASDRTPSRQLYQNKMARLLTYGSPSELSPLPAATRRSVSKGFKPPAFKR